MEVDLFEERTESLREGTVEKDMVKQYVGASKRATEAVRLAKQFPNECVDI